VRSRTVSSPVRPATNPPTDPVCQEDGLGAEIDVEAAPLEGAKSAEPLSDGNEVDRALAFALSEATRAGEWATVTALANAVATRRGQP
jgi:hypothetical protein